MITKKLWFFIFKSPNPLQNALTAISSDCPQCVCLIFCFCFFRPWNRSLSVLDMGCEASGRAVRGRQLHTTSFNEHAHAVGHADMFGFSAGLFVGPVFSTLHSIPLKGSQTTRSPGIFNNFEVHKGLWKMMKHVNLVLRNCGIAKTEVVWVVCIPYTGLIYMLKHLACTSDTKMHRRTPIQVTSSDGLLEFSCKVGVRDWNFLKYWTWRCGKAGPCWANQF